MTATTDTVTPAVTGTATIVLTALDPVHHGAGTSGNTSLLRMQDAIAPDGTRTRTPFVSGASLRHTIRAALAWHLIDTLDVEDGSLPKAAVDLLWSGGALTKTGAQTDLRAVQERHTLLPQLPLLGYSLGSDLIPGSLRVSHAHLVCDDNRWRLPAPALRLPAAGVRAADWLDEDFGTRHDLSGGPTDRLVTAEQAMFGDVAVPVAAQSTQMIYDVQVARAGSSWSFTLGVDCAVPGEVDALAAAIARITADGVWQLGAKAAQGFGRCRVVASDAADVLGDIDAAAARHTDHLAGHRDAILDILRAAS